MGDQYFSKSDRLESAIKVLAQSDSSPGSTFLEDSTFDPFDDPIKNPKYCLDGLFQMDSHKSTDNMGPTVYPDTFGIFFHDYSLCDDKESFQSIHIDTGTTQTCIGKTLLDSQVFHYSGTSDSSQAKKKLFRNNQASSCSGKDHPSGLQDNISSKKRVADLAAICSRVACAKFKQPTKEEQENTTNYTNYKVYTEADKRTMVLHILELGALVNWDYNLILKHLRHTRWMKEINFNGNESQTQDFGWKLGDTLTSKFNEAVNSSTKESKVSTRDGESLRKKWHQICKNLSGFDAFLFSSKNHTDRIAKALSMQTRNSDEVIVVARERIQLIATMFLQETKKNLRKRKINDTF